MSDAPKLFMVLLGCTPAGRFTEQHDIFFGIGTDLKSLVPDIQAYWPGGHKIHIDAWREVTLVEPFRVDVSARSADDRLRRNDADQSHRLFFINLGGYKPGEFDEFHYKMIIAAPDKGGAIRIAKETAFYRHTGFKGAESHIDDKYGVDVDDIYDIRDILPEQIRSRYQLQLTSAPVDTPPDQINLGYFQLHKL